MRSQVKDICHINNGYINCKVLKGVIAVVSVREKFSWVPNFFTMANLSLGFFAILISSLERGDARFQIIGGGFILLAMLCDGIDGFAARILKSYSPMGAQLDSLADLVTFGIAPAVLMYSYQLYQFKYSIGPDFYIPVGMLIAAAWPVCAAFRLARFNISHESESFVGLPSPVAGTVVALMPLVFSNIPIPHILLAVIFLLTAFMMVSTVKYTKHQVTVLRHFSPLRLGIILSFLLGVVIFIGFRYGLSYAAASIFTLVLLYIFTGLMALLIQVIQEYRV